MNRIGTYNVREEYMSAAATNLDFKNLSQEVYEHGITNLPDILPSGGLTSPMKMLISNS
jgi:hypothetical protein